MLGKPIPTPASILPYDQETTVRDLKATMTGRLARFVIKKGAQIRTNDDGKNKTLDAFVEFMPMRVMAMGSEGALSHRAIKRLIWALNATRKTKKK